ncbi:unnamed protein product [Schistosoma mattheei]|uniref:Uncharacterized protein n=1 Tax=Schistosoma mattheei TaxID=31246 RepID=A0AA85B1N9_9TREM|nr:unnamed protein product [Schistosoma mattheei]
MSIDCNLSPTIEPIRQLFTNKLLQNPIKYKNIQIEAYEACMKSIQNIQDQYNIDLNQLNTLNSIIINDKSYWKWEIINSTIDYIPSFYYHQNYNRSNKIINNNNNNNNNQFNNQYSIKHSMIIPSTPCKKSNQIDRNHHTIDNNGIYIKDQFTCKQSIPLNNEMKQITLHNNQSCNLFTLWQPKIKRENYIHLNNNQLTNKLKNQSSFINYRSKSLDHDLNHLIQLNQLNQYHKTKIKNQFSSCIDLYQMNNKQIKNQYETIDPLSKEINRISKNEHMIKKSKQKIINNHLLIT